MSIYAVNGKEPIAAWIESLDPEPITSSKSTDFVGTNHGTLTDMDLTADPNTARRPDTEAGGSRALVFDGSDDRVQFGGITNSVSSRSVSLWFKLAAINVAHYLFGNETNLANAFGLGIYIRSNNRLRYYNYNANAFIDASVSVSLATWHHAVCVWDGTNSRMYLDNVLVATGSGDSGIWSSGNYTAGKWNMGSLFLNGRLDHMMIFDQDLDNSDVSYLWNSGTGRGRVAVTAESRRRRQSVSGGVL